MLPAVRQAIRAHALLRAGDTVVVGVSGGADSVGLAYALRHLARPLRLRLVLAHLHHGLRGRAADRDAAFVRALAARLGLECVAGSADFAALAARDGLSVEMAGRQARHEFFRRVVAECGAQALALAHTADDQAETVLLKLARGAGRGGLGAMSFDSRLEGLRIVRPLLEVPHAAIVAFLRAHRLRWREDRSNRDPAYLRNRVRHRVLPVLAAELNPAIRTALARAAEIWRAEDAWLEAAAARRLRLLRDPRRPQRLPARPLHAAPQALRRRMIIRWLAENGVPPEEIGFDAVARVEALAEQSGGSAAAPLGGGRSVERVYGGLRFLPAGPAPAAAGEVVLAVPGTTADPSGPWRIRTGRARGFVRRRERGIGRFPAEAYLDLRKAEGGPLRWRGIRAGDRMSPLGMHGSVKLQDVLVNAKIPRSERARVRVLACGGEVVWLPGYRIARGWEVPSPAAPSLRIRVSIPIALPPG